MEKVITYGRFVKIEHTLFSLPLLVSGALLARESMSATTFVLILIAGTGARTAALGMNRVLDRTIDARNPRTKTRELPAGAMTLTEGLLVTGAGTLVFLLAAYWISPLCLKLAPIPLAIFLIYPLMKRFTMWAHLGVGAALAMGPLGAWFAVKLDFEGFGSALLLCLFTLFWVAGFDVIYATLDIDFDREAGLHSLPAKLGPKRALALSLGFHVIAFALLTALYFLELRGVLAFLMLLAVGMLLLLEHRKANDVELAFFRINALVGFVVLLFVAAGVYPLFA